MDASGIRTHDDMIANHYTVLTTPNKRIDLDDQFKSRADAINLYKQFMLLCSYAVLK